MALSLLRARELRGVGTRTARALCSAPASAPAPAPSEPSAPSKPASTPASSSTSDSSPSSTPSDKAAFDSRDIAFKPTTDGWGYSQQYASGWDRIFAKGGGASTPAKKAPAEAVADASASARLCALQRARELGAISDALFEQARREGGF